MIGTLAWIAGILPRRRFACLFAALSLLLSGCGLEVLAERVIPQRKGDPEPFVAFREYLDSVPPVTRASVVHWQGEPTFTRRNGRVLFYVGVRKLDVPFDAPRDYQSHVLVIELDPDDLVERHERVVESGCTRSGICIEGPSDLERSGNPWKSAATYRRKYLDGLRVFEAIPDPVGALERKAGPGRCLVFSWLSQPRDSDVRIRLGDQGATKVLGRWARNYVEGAFEPGTIRVTLEWSEYAAVIGGMRRTRSDDAEFDCPAGARRYLQIGLAATERHGRGIVALVVPIAEDIGQAALAGRMREMD